jgi:hypothetical protein
LAIIIDGPLLPRVNVWTCCVGLSLEMLAAAAAGVAVTVYLGLVLCRVTGIRYGFGLLHVLPVVPDTHAEYTEFLPSHKMYNKLRINSRHNGLSALLERIILNEILSESRHVKFHSRCEWLLINV